MTATGAGRRLYVHDIAGDPTAREEFLAQGRSLGAETPYLRGHGPADRMRGAYYDLAGFTDEIARLLREHPAGPWSLVGAGLGGLVCAAVAAGLPERVADLRIVEGDSGAWPQRLVVTDAPAGQLLAPNPAWLDGVRAATGQHPPGDVGTDDPVLALGPPVPVRREELRARLAGLRCPWRGDRTWFTALFP